MAYRATVFSIMIESAVKTSELREALQRAACKWNGLYSSAGGAVFVTLEDMPTDTAEAKPPMDSDILVELLEPSFTDLTEDLLSKAKKHAETGKPVLFYLPEEGAGDALSSAERSSDLEARCRALGSVEWFRSEGDLMEKFVQNLRISLDKDQYIRRQIPALLVKPAAAKVAPGTQTVPSEEQDLSDEAKILLRAAYESEQGILIRKVWGGSLRIHVSGYSFTVNAPAVIMRWEQAFKQLMMRQLISKNIRADNFWRLTDEGKKIAAELSDDLLLPLEKFKRTNSRIDA